MSDLVIVESPAKAKTIKKYLGGNYEVIASMGHVRDLPKARLSVDIKKKFAPKYEIIKGKEKLVEELTSQPTLIERERRFLGTLRIFSACRLMTTTELNLTRLPKTA